jgi:hypothetical protein
MTQFAYDTEAEAAEKIDAADDHVKARIKGLENEAREVNAMRSARQEEITELNEQIRDETHRLHVARREEEKMGAYRTETTEVDPKTGGEVTTKKLTGYVEKIERNLRALVATRRELMEKKSKPAWIEQVREDLGVAAPRPLVPADPIEWTPNEGESIPDGYAREFGTLSALLKREEEIWNAGRTVAEMETAALREIDRTADSGAPGFDGFRRGNSYEHRGRTVATTPEIAWPRERIGLDAKTAADALALICWLFRDQMKAAALEKIRADFSDEATISAADKPAMLADIASKIWRQREIVEAAFLFARANGVKNLNRPRGGTPTEILIGVLQWKKGRAPMIVNAPPAAPVEDADDLDFEQDEGNDE